MEVNILGLQFEVEYDYQPYEPAEPYYAGAAEEVVLTAIYIEGQNVIEILNDYWISLLEEQILVQIDEND